MCTSCKKTIKLYKSKRNKNIKKKKFCYSKVGDTDMDSFGVRAHNVRAFAASKAFYGDVSMDQILQACHWKSHNTFTSFYLKDLSGQNQKDLSYHLGSFVAAQRVMTPS